MCVCACLPVAPINPALLRKQNDEERRLHGLATPMRKFSNISPRPEFRHFKPVYDVSKISIRISSVTQFLYLIVLLLFFLTLRERKARMRGT